MKFEGEHVMAMFIICASIILLTLINRIHDYNIRCFYKCEECSKKYDIRKKEV